jgi:anti-sigma regulatory factor (Ser/Thr protein kinase)
MSQPAPSTAAPGPFVHEAVFYRDGAEYLAGTVPFIRAGLAAGEPVLVAVPGANLEHIRRGLGPDADQARFVDMADAGRNPSRIIPWVLDAFLTEHAGRPVRVIGEPIWPGRTAAEYSVGVQHEAMINEVFAGRPAAIICPYDVSRLDAVALADAERTHPILVAGGARRPSSRYAPPVEVVGAYNRPLGEPPASAQACVFGAVSLAGVRHSAVALARGAGASEAALIGLELAVNEVATNAVAHGGGGGVAYLWVEASTLVCEIRDAGHIADPMAGRRPPARADASGRGLVLAHHVCSLVQVHTRPGATVTRLYLPLR